VHFQLNLRKLLKISYLLDSLRELSYLREYDSRTATAIETIRYHKCTLARQLIHDIFRDLNWSPKMHMAKLLKEKSSFGPAQADQAQPLT